jgi:hypothetical protein
MSRSPVRRASALLDQFRRHRHRVRGDGWLCVHGRWWREHNAQIRHLDPSILPGEGKAREPKFLTAELQAQQQCVGQQGNQQRKREPPAMGTRATNRWLAGASRIQRGRRQWLGR